MNVRVIQLSWLSIETPMVADILRCMQRIYSPHAGAYRSEHTQAGATSTRPFGLDAEMAFTRVPARNEQI